MERKVFLSALGGGAAAGIIGLLARAADAVVFAGVFSSTGVTRRSAETSIAVSGSRSTSSKHQSTGTRSSTSRYLTLPHA